jgi:hypothetical protein
MSSISTADLRLVARIGGGLLLGAAILSGAVSAGAGAKTPRPAAGSVEIVVQSTRLVHEVDLLQGRVTPVVKKRVSTVRVRPVGHGDDAMVVLIGADRRKYMRTLRRWRNSGGISWVIPAAAIDAQAKGQGVISVFPAKYILHERVKHYFAVVRLSTASASRTARLTVGSRPLKFGGAEFTITQLSVRTQRCLLQVGGKLFGETRYVMGQTGPAPYLSPNTKQLFIIEARAFRA